MHNENVENMIEQDTTRREEIDIISLITFLWRRKLLIIVCIVASALFSVFVALTSEPVYRSEALLSVAKDKTSSLASSIAGQFGGLASLVGVDVGGGNDIDTIVAIMESRTFTEAFVRKHIPLKLLFPDLWDEDAGAWVEEPTPESIYRRFGNARSVSVDKISGFVTIRMDWNDPVLAAQWVNLMVSELNQHVRESEIVEAKKSIEYLGEQIKKTNVMEIQSVLYGLIEAQQKTIMLANVRDDYALKPIDLARPPENRMKPKRKMIVMLGTLAGGLGGVILVFLIQFFDSYMTRGKRVALN